MIAAKSRRRPPLHFRRQVAQADAFAAAEHHGALDCRAQLTDVAGPRIRGEPRLSDEVDAVEWIDPAGTLPSPATPELGDVLVRAARIAAETA